MSFDFLTALNQPIDELINALPHERWKIHKAGDYLGDCRELGIGFTANHKRIITAIFLYAEGYEGRRQYPHALPDGLTFATSRAEVRNLLGDPAASADQGTQWDLYQRGQVAISWQYAPGEQSLQLVTLLTPEATPPMME